MKPMPTVLLALLALLTLPLAVLLCALLAVLALGALWMRGVHALLDGRADRADRRHAGSAPLTPRPR